MTTYTVYGASDDLVEIDTDDGSAREELDAPLADFTRFELRTADGAAGLAVLARYDIGGCWMVAPVALDEDIAVPADWTWDITRGDGNFPGPSRYTMVLTIDTGDTPATLVLPAEAE